MKGEHHKATGDVMSILLVLARHGGTMPTSDVATAACVHRDTARRILRELASGEWVRQFDDATTGESWSIGPELPRIGLDYQRRLVEAAERLRRDFDRVTTPMQEG